MDLTNRTALVTGATSGIGRATALRIAGAGAAVAITGRKSSALADLAAEIESLGGRAVALVADLTQRTDRERLVARALEDLGGLDLLVNAAGVIATGTVENTSLEAFEAMFALNTTAPFHLMQLTTPALKLRKGAVVNVSSVTGIRAFPGVLSYCSSKAALDQLTRCAALELAEHGVRVNAVCPGVVVTELHKRGGMDDTRYAGFLEHSRTTHPLGRVGDADEVARLIAFLGFGESGWITGVTVPIDGGRHLTCAR